MLSSSTVGLILARGGSKGVPLKNLRCVGGVSLVARAVHAAKLAGLDDITVSTDHPLIALEALKSGAAVFHRSSKTATDWAPSIWGASEFLESRPEAETLVLIQATSPFVRPAHLRLALNKLREPVAFDCVFAVTRSFKLRWKENQGKLEPINFQVRSRPRRQSWEGELIETGAFYITRHHLIGKGHFQNNNCTFVEIPSLESLEIDSHLDLEVANTLLSSNLV